VNRGLWDNVTPSLRGVAVRPAKPLVEARFLYEAVGEAERMIVADVETEVIADLWQSAEVAFVAVASPAEVPRALEEGEEWVYLRQEE
jgi:hypothetical protein